MKINTNKNCGLIIQNDYPIKCMSHEDSVSICIIQYNPSDKSKQEHHTIINDSDLKLESIKDGYYTIQEIVLPNLSFIKKYLREYDCISFDLIDKLDEENVKVSDNCSLWSKFLKKIRYIKKKHIDKILYEDKIIDEQPVYEDRISIKMSDQNVIEISVPHTDQFKDENENYGLPFPLKVTLSNNIEYTIPPYTEFFDQGLDNYWITSVSPNSVFEKDINIDYIKVEVVDNILKTSSSMEVPLDINIIMEDGTLIPIEIGEEVVLEECSNKNIKYIFPNKYLDYNIGYKNTPEEEIPLQIYFYHEGKIYHINGQELEEIQLEDLLDVNPETSNIYSEIKHFFSVCNLRKCFIKACQEIFNSTAFDRCFKSKVDEELRYRRDLIWAALNVIQYMVDCNQLEEAQRLLEQIMSCNGLCSKFNEDCGCNKKVLDCGCSK